MRAGRNRAEDHHADRPRRRRSRLVPGRHSDRIRYPGPPGSGGRRARPANTTRPPGGRRRESRLVSRRKAARRGRLEELRRSGDDERGRLAPQKLRLTRAGIADETRPAWSPDGRRIAFVGNGLYAVAQNGTGLRRIRREGAGGGASWSPTGRRIAFDCFARRFETCTVGVDGSGLRGLSRAGRHPNWSSRNLVATTLEEPPHGVLIVAPDGRLVRHLRGALSLSNWSPDGRRLVIAYEVTTNTRLYATDPAGKSSDRLTARRGTIDRAPVWSPDGARIVFRRHRPGRCSLVVLDPRTHRTRVLVGRTKDRYCDDRPDWGRGRGILYESGGDLWVVPPGGGRPRRITNTTVAETSPRFAPHGEIGFLAPGGIWVRHADASRSLLVPGGGPFAWSHDGRSLAYAASSSNEGQNDLYLKVGSDPPRKLFAGIDGTPSWSADDRRLVFSHTDPYPGEATYLVVIDLSGSARVDLAATRWATPTGALASSYCSLRSAELSDCLVFSTPSNRSPCSATRRRTTSIVNWAGSSFSFTSSQRNGVETGAPACGRTE